jgi:exodeoxyribonuclease V alpha subunit
VEASMPLLERDDVPDHVRSLTSPRVLAVERELVARMTVGGGSPSIAPPRHLVGSVVGLQTEQCAAVALLAGFGPITVLEGAAGAGKTATLAATRRVLAKSGRGMVVVTPTRKAAQVAGRQVGAGAHSVAWLLHQHGYRWEEDGRWSRTAAEPVEAARLARGDTLVVDEAGLLDQDTARALFELADEAGARVASWVTGTSSRPWDGAGCSTSPSVMRRTSA